MRSELVKICTIRTFLVHLEVELLALAVLDITGSFDEAEAPETVSSIFENDI